MADTKGVMCGISKLGFRGWALSACEFHDKSYTTNSWSQLNLSRKEIDDVFLSHLLLLSKSGTFKPGKVVASYAMYGVVRALGWLWWEGER